MCSPVADPKQEHVIKQDFTPQCSILSSVKFYRSTSTPCNSICNAKLQGWQPKRHLISGRISQFYGCRSTSCGMNMPRDHAVSSRRTASQSIIFATPTLAAGKRSPGIFSHQTPNIQFLIDLSLHHGSGRVRPLQGRRAASRTRQLRTIAAPIAGRASKSRRACHRTWNGPRDWSCYADGLQWSTCLCRPPGSRTVSKWHASRSIRH